MDCREIISLAAEHEIVWANWIISEGVLGLTKEVVDGFIKNLADKRCAMLGMSKMYGNKNPVSWFDDYSSVEDGKTNFFEGKNANYEHGKLEW